MITLYALLIGFFLDLFFGDPAFLPHPIRFIGMLIDKLESSLRRFFPKGDKGEKYAGVVLVVLVVLISVGIPAGILYVAQIIHPLVRLIIESIMCYQILALKSLKTESMKVCTALEGHDTEGARYAVSMIVGRDTKALDDEGIAKAAVETVAENTSDGIIAPMIFIAVLGAGAGFFYKAVNTMDSMVGYKNDKYIHLGRTAAKLDDILNYLPARISAYIMIASSFLLRLSWKDAYRIYRRDRYNHSSPNSAHTEAVCAGALGIQLGGDAYYFGKLHKKQSIGDQKRTVVPNDIRLVNRLLYMTAVIGILMLSLIRIIFLVFISNHA